MEEQSRGEQAAHDTFQATTKTIVNEETYGKKHNINNCSEMIVALGADRIMNYNVISASIHIRHFGKK